MVWLLVLLRSLKIVTLQSWWHISGTNDYAWFLFFFFIVWAASAKIWYKTMWTGSDFLCKEMTKLKLRALAFHQSEGLPYLPADRPHPKLSMVFMGKKKEWGRVPGLLCKWFLTSIQEKQKYMSSFHTFKDLCILSPFFLPAKIKDYPLST